MPTTKTRSVGASAAKNAKYSSQQNQEQIEDAILRYQAALATENAGVIENAYREVCRLYPPLRFVRTWFQKYRYLYDTRDDFIQDYLYQFCKALAGWKPRDTRPESRFGGKGEFKNYFISTLAYNYSIRVKQGAAAKRTVASKCPICDAWGNLATHLFECHQELMWEQLELHGIDVDTLDNCPFCKSHRTPRKMSCEHQDEGACPSCANAICNEALRKHLLNKHSTLLFERFRALYPTHVTLPSRPTSVHTEAGSEGEELNLYDTVPDSPSVDNLLACDLSEVQKLIVQRVFNGATSVPYDAALYKCSQDEFEREMEGLRSKMALCGLEG